MIAGIQELVDEQLSSSQATPNLNPAAIDADEQPYDQESDEESDEEHDLANFKGKYEAYEWDKYICPETGAHFNFIAACKVLDILRQQRGDPKCE